MRTYGLDPLHYHTAPGLTFDAGLKYTGVTLDLITDEEKFLFIEAGIRGGISVISHRYSKINHPRLSNIGFYNASEPNRQILYLDANNLYGHAMMQYLPIGEFEWTKTSEEELLTMRADDEYGAIFEIDYVIPEDKHDKFANYPIAPERKQIHGHMLSEYQKSILREQFAVNHLTDGEVEEKIQTYTSSEKLILDLKPKQKYIVHYKTLQLYVQLGMQITRIHRVLRFKQQPWLAPYIRANTEMRQKATNEFEKNFYKLMNNAFLGIQ